MSGPRFFETRAGQKFYEHTVPELIRQITRLAEATERILAALEARGDVAPQDAEDLDTGEVQP